MKIVLAGPLETNSVRASMRLALDGAPPGTAQTPVTPLAAGLRALGHEIHLLTLDPSVMQPETYTDSGVGVTFCPYRGPPHYRARVRALDLFEMEIGHVEAQIQVIKPDIVHAHWTYEYAETAVRSRIPHLVTMHDLGWEYFWQFRDAYRLMRLIMKYRTMPRIRNLTVVAPFMARKARQYGYFGPVTVIPNGIEMPALSSGTSRQELAKPLLVTVGNRSRIKNVGSSLQAVSLIKKSIPGAELHLFGPGLDKEYAGRAPGVVAHGNVLHSDLMNFLQNKATLLVHPARLETFGMIIAEAKVRGVPVVAGIDAGGVAYVCGRNAGCALVDIDDPSAIAAAAIDILSDPPAYDQNRKLARIDAMHRFANDMVTIDYERLYRNILGAAV